jgi:hypothetical protein
MTSFWVWCSALLLAALAASWWQEGAVGAMGYGLGIAATAFNLAGLVGIVRLTGRHMEGRSGDRRSKVGAFLIVLAFFMKLPLFVGLGMVAWWLGGGAPTCFLIGLGLVYSLFGWALLKR